MCVLPYYKMVECEVAPPAGMADPRAGEGLCIIVRSVSGSFRVAIEPAGTSWKSVRDLKVRATPLRACWLQDARATNTPSREHVQDGIRAATGFDPQHQRLFKENGEEYAGEPAPAPASNCPLGSVCLRSACRGER